MTTLQRARRTALAMSVLGFAMSRAYPLVLARGNFLLVDYFLGVAMTASHIGFVLAAGVLLRPWLAERLPPERPGVPALAACLSCLTYLWAP